jgi:hypothetical protein
VEEGCAHSPFSLAAELQQIYPAAKKTLPDQPVSSPGSRDKCKNKSIVSVPKILDPLSLHHIIPAYEKLRKILCLSTDDFVLFMLLS